MSYNLVRSVTIARPTASASPGGRARISAPAGHEHRAARHRGGSGGGSGAHARSGGTAGERERDGPADFRDFELAVNRVGLFVAALFLTVVGLVAACIPALRAARIDPNVALRGL
jgi:hypothetical protein